MSKKVTKTIMNAEIKKLQKLHLDFESQVKRRMSQLEISSANGLQEKELRQSEDLFRTTFSHAAIGIAHVELATGRWIRVNKRFCEIAGWSEKELLKQTFLDITHPDDHAEDLRLIDGILQGRVHSISMEKRYIRKDGSNRWVYATASIIRDEEGKPKYGIAIVEDIHEKKWAEDMLKILSESSKILSETLDYKEGLSSVMKLIVPQFADWCFIDLIGENKVLHRVKVGYASDKDKNIAEELYNQAPRNKASYIRKAIYSGKSVFLKKLTPKKLIVNDEQHLKLIQNMKQKSFMTIPLIARGKVIGAISFVLVEGSRIFSNVDLLFAEQVANRIALAIDNSNLYHQARKAVKVRDDFLAIASHELKSSLTTIKALAQILERDNRNNGSDRSIPLFTKMDTQLNRTTKLINDLLDVGRIHTGRFTMLKERLYIDNFVKEVIENCQRFSPMHKIVLKGETGEMIYADKDRIHQVIVNLITNAIKYSLDSYDIVVMLGKDEKNITISVRDFGIGIEKDKTKKIFERFFRADNEVRDRTSGLGLGLYISHELIKQHNGSIKVKSKVGKGSTFTVILPRLLAKTEQKAPKHLTR